MVKLVELKMNKDSWTQSYEIVSYIFNYSNTGDKTKSKQVSLLNLIFAVSDCDGPIFLCTKK